MHLAYRINGDSANDCVFQSLVVATMKALLRGFVHLVSRNVEPVEAVSMVKRKLPDKFTLRASVAIAEWMNRVKFTKIIGGPIRKFGGITVCQMSIRAEALESLIQDGRDLLV